MNPKPDTTHHRPALTLAAACLAHAAQVETTEAAIDRTARRLFDAERGHLHSASMSDGTLVLELDALLGGLEGQQMGEADATCRKLSEGLALLRKIRPTGRAASAFSAMCGRSGISGPERLRILAHLLTDEAANAFAA